MEEIYNKWQLIDKGIGNNEPYQFTKSELLDFAKHYHSEQLGASVVIEPKLQVCDECGSKNIQKAGNFFICKDCWG